MSFLLSGMSVDPSGPVERPDTGSSVTVPVAVTRIRSPLLTISPVLVQSRFLATSIVAVLTGLVSLRGFSSGAGSGEAVGGGLVVTEGRSGDEVSGSRLGDELD